MFFVQRKHRYSQHRNHPPPRFPPLKSAPANLDTMYVCLSGWAPRRQPTWRQGPRPRRRVRFTHDAARALLGSDCDSVACFCPKTHGGRVTVTRLNRLAKAPGSALYNCSNVLSVNSLVTRGDVADRLRERESVCKIERQSETAGT